MNYEVNKEFQSSIVQNTAIPTQENREYTVFPVTAEPICLPWYLMVFGAREEPPKTEEEEPPPPPLRKPSPHIFDLIESAGSVPDISAVLHWNSQESIEFEKPYDETAVAFTQALVSVSRLLKQFLGYTRFFLDLLTFPTSNSYEPLSRLRGTFYLLSWTYRNIKGFGPADDRASFRTYIRDEMREFKKHSTAFTKGCTKLLDKFRLSFATLSSKLNRLRKIQKQLKLEMLPDQGKAGGMYIGPIYSTDQDPRELKYYETVMSSKGEDPDDLSMSLLWTNKTLFYKMFRSSNWHDLSEVTPRHQMRLLISLTEQVRAIFFESQSELEEAIGFFTKSCSTVMTSLDPFHTSLAKANKQDVGSQIRFRVQCDFQRVEITRCKVEQMLETLENSVAWISSVTRDVVAMASMDQGETEVYAYKLRNCYENPIYRTLCCMRPVDPFLSETYEAIRIRVCITAELKSILIDSNPSTNVNEVAHMILVRQGKQDVEEYKHLRNNEWENIQKVMSSVDSEHGLPPFGTGFLARMKTRDGDTYINVFTVGHEVRSK